MSTIALYQLLKRIPDVTDDEAKAAADSIAQTNKVVTKADLDAALSRLEARLTRLIFGVVFSVAVIIAVAGAITKLT